MIEFEIIKNALIRLEVKFESAEWVIKGTPEQLINIENLDGTFTELWFVDGALTTRRHIT